LPRFHHRPLPDFSTLLSGRWPPDDVGFQSERLWIWYNHTDEGWSDPQPHAHRESDECFIVLHGSLEVEVEGERYTVGPREFCCFPAGVFHRIVTVHPLVEALMLRSPLVDDKLFERDQATDEH
jgi:mannose-6-phosphate isomerase-like protein (cupin superfamily)